MRSLRVALLGAAVAALAQPASAQYAPQPSVAARGQTYAIQVSPGTYVIHRAHERNYPYVGCGADCGPVEPEPRRRTHRRTHNDPALIEELQRRRLHTKKHAVVHTTRVVRDRPVVIEHRRVVDDPPRVIERVRVEGAPPRASIEAPREIVKPGERRVIRADAEVTILGPDRMSIRLFRRSDARRSKAGE